MRLFSLALALVFALSIRATHGQHVSAKPLIDPHDVQCLHRLLPSSSQVTLATSDTSTISVSIAPGEETYPGITLRPSGGKEWDLSQWGAVQATVANTGKNPITLALRVDNDGPWQKSPNNTENLTLQPGESGTIRVIFGYSFGHKPAFALNPAAVVQVLLFAGKSAQPQSFRIDSIQATGLPGEKPPIDPEMMRTAPVEGYLVGGDVRLDLKTQVVANDGVKAAQDPRSHTLSLAIPAGEKSPLSIELKPATGRWDLRDGTQVRVVLDNSGTEAVTLAAHLTSNSGSTDTITAAAPIPAGVQAELVVPFAPAIGWHGIPHSGDGSSSAVEPQTGTHFASDAVSALVLSIPSGSKAQSLTVRSVRLESPRAQVPDWLGKRPPAGGEWVKTFDDEFDGKAIDAAKWNVVGRNYYDNVSRFVKENVIVDAGAARLRYEKRPGSWANPADGKPTEYASGFLDTYGKWTQRYGYFEARMKLPRSPGLWPAFWMMPDRGVAYAGDRGSTADGGMEFDIMEHLTRWGPCRYNIAMHWDGYGKEHKSTGTENLYVQPDKDGYITAGLLWTPGSAVYYCNGKAVAHWDDPRVSNVPSDLMFTLPSGGWDNNALDDRTLPAELTIDYVRCWQRKDLQALPEK